MTLCTSEKADLLFSETEESYYNHFGYWLDTYADEVFNVASPNDIITLKSAKAFKQMVDEAIEKNEPIKTTQKYFGTIE